MIETHDLSRISLQSSVLGTLLSSLSLLLVLTVDSGNGVFRLVQHCFNFRVF
jgi:hypothetical protein